MLQESDSKRTGASVFEVVLHVEFSLCSRSLTCRVGTLASMQPDSDFTSGMLQESDFESQGSSQIFCS